MEKIKKYLTILLLISFAILLTIYTYHQMATLQDFFVDDAYITLRYAKNWLFHNQLTWNLNEQPVEGYSNFTFVLLGMLALKLKLDPILFFKSISLCCLLLSFFMTYKLARHWLSPLNSIAPVIMQLSFTGHFYWAASGMETIVFQLLVSVSLFFFFKTIVTDKEVRGPSKKHGTIRKPFLALCAISLFLLSLYNSIFILIPAILFLSLAYRFNGKFSIEKVQLTDFYPKKRLMAATAFCFFLTSLTRIEGVAVIGLIFLCFAGHFFISYIYKERYISNERKLFIRLLLLFAIPYTIYFIWRWIHFSQFLPNVVLCKGIFTDNFNKKPTTILVDYWKDFKIMIILQFCTLYFIRDFRIYILCAILIFYYIIAQKVDPVTSQFLRYLLPVIPIACIITSLAVIFLIRNFFPLLSDVIQTLILFTIVYNLFIYELQNFQRLHEHFVRSDTKRNKALVSAMQYIKTKIKPTDTIALSEAGIIAYHIDGKIIDTLCLNSREATQSKAKFSLPKFSQYIISQHPKYISSYQYLNFFKNNYMITSINHIDEAIMLNSDFRRNYILEKAIMTNDSERGTRAIVFYKKRNCHDFSLRQKLRLTSSDDV